MSVLALVFELADPSPISFQMRCWKDDSSGGVESRKDPGCLGVTYSGSWCMHLNVNTLDTKVPRTNNTMG